MTNVVSLRRIPEPPCDTEPAEIAEAGMRVPTLTAADRKWLGKFLARFRRKPVTTFHRCLAVHMHYADQRNRSALR